MVLTLSRILGMGFSFLLFVFLAWESKADVGLFRTVLTFLIISELLPLLGMHKWLNKEMADHTTNRQGYVLIAVLFAAVIAMVIGGVYLLIANSSVYPEGVSRGLFLVATATVASGIMLCNHSTFVGIGQSHKVGYITLVENFIRSSIGIVLLLLGQSVLDIILVYVFIRWFTAIFGAVILFRQLPHENWYFDRQLASRFMTLVPTFAVIMIGFLTVRYSGMIALPWLHSEAEAGIFAVPYQLYDLVVLLPTVLIISANYAMCNSANHSVPALRRVINQATYINAIYIFAVVSVAVVLAEPIVISVFGEQYRPSVLPLQVMMVSTPLLVLDQVYAQALIAAGKPRYDLISVVTGAVVTLISIPLLVAPLGALGAALGMFCSLLVMVGIRLFLLKTVVMRVRLWSVLWRHLFAALLSGFLLLSLDPMLVVMQQLTVFMWTVQGVAGLFLYFLAFRLLGGLSPEKRNWMRLFLQRR